MRTCNRHFPGTNRATSPAQLSRYLKGTRSTTLTNYLRIARALGYQTKLTLERAEVTVVSSQVLSDLKITPHQVRRAPRRR